MSKESFYKSCGSLALQFFSKQLSRKVGGSSAHGPPEATEPTCSGSQNNCRGSHGPPCQAKSAWRSSRGSSAEGWQKVCVWARGGIISFFNRSLDQRPCACSDSAPAAPMLLTDTHLKIDKDHFGDIFGMPVLYDRFVRTDCFLTKRF